MPDEAQLDRAVALLQDLTSMKTDAPEVPRAWDRLLARTWDLGLFVAGILAIFIAGAFLTAVVWGNREVEEYQNPGPGEVALSIVCLALVLAMFAWNEVMGFGPNRQTLGKRLMGFHVAVQGSRTTPGFGCRVGRAVTLLTAGLVMFGLWALAAWLLPPGLAAAAILGVSAAVMVAFVGRGGRGLHDRLWGTYLTRPR